MDLFVVVTIDQDGDANAHLFHLEAHADTYAADIMAEGVYSEAKVVPRHVWLSVPAADPTEADDVD